MYIFSSSEYEMAWAWSAHGEVLWSINDHCASSAVHRAASTICKYLQLLLYPRAILIKLYTDIP